MKRTEKQLINRRETLRLLGAAGATVLVGGGSERVLRLWPAASVQAAEASSLPALANVDRLMATNLFTPKPRLVWDASQISCTSRPALTEGPFFVDELLNRSDIRPDPSNGTAKAGVPLKVKFTIGEINGSSCAPIAGALVDLWHCDASGGYSDVSGQGNPNNLGQKFLRGYQITDSVGSVEFTTIYPGWYSGRTVHMHYKVRLFAGTTRTYEFTSQVCFDDTLTDQVFTQAPYNTRGTRNTRNSNDNIYQSGGSTLLLSLASDGAGGYTTSYIVGLTNVPDGVTGVSSVSAASFNGSLAPEGICALFGAGLSSSTAAATSTTLPTTLGGVQVFVRDASGTTRNAGLFFVSPTQINFQLPAGTSAGTAVIYVQNGSTVTGQGSAAVASVAPGIFTANSTGKGVPAALALRVKADGTQTYEPIAQFDATQNAFVPVPIDLGASTDQVYLVGFGTGLRNRSSLSGVTATIGGTNASVLYFGSQGTYAGLDQFNLGIPRSLAGRGTVDVVLSVDGKTANTVTLNIK